MQNTPSIATITDSLRLRQDQIAQLERAFMSFDEHEMAVAEELMNQIRIEIADLKDGLQILINHRRHGYCAPPCLQKQAS